MKSDYIGVQIIFLYRMCQVTHLQLLCKHLAPCILCIQPTVGPKLFTNKIFNIQLFFGDMACLHSQDSLEAQLSHLLCAEGHAHAPPRPSIFNSMGNRLVHTCRVPCLLPSALSRRLSYFIFPPSSLSPGHQVLFTHGGDLIQVLQLLENTRPLSLTHSCTPSIT